MSDIEQINESVGKLTEEIVSCHAELDKAKEEREATGEKLKKQEAIATELASKIVEKQELEGANKRIDELEARMERAKTVSNEAGLKPSEHREATNRFFVYGGDDSKVQEFTHGEKYGNLINSREYRTLNITDNTKGGYLVDPQTEMDIAKNALDLSPIRQVARATPVTSSMLKLKLRTSGPTMTIHGESAKPASKSQSAYSEVKIPVFHGMVETQASIDSLLDIPNYENEVIEDAGEAVGDGEGYYFVLGSAAAGQPEGIATAGYSTVTGGDTSAHNLEANDFYNLWGDVKTKYRNNGVFLFNTKSLVTILSMETTTEARVWQPGFKDGPISTIAGKPFLVCEDIADDGTQNNLAVFFGDWKKAYRIADRSGIKVLRNPYSSPPDVVFLMDKRFGGGAYQKEAATSLKMG